MTEIAGLSERLRERTTRLGSSSPDAVLHFMTGILPLLDEAATAVDERDALQARVKELENDAIRQEYNRLEWIKRAEAEKARALRAEQERDEASRMNHIETEKLEDRIEALQLRFDNLTRLVGGIVTDLRCSADSAAVFEAIAELRQERDEAYERLNRAGRKK